MSRASALFQLQAIDLELDAHHARLRQIEAETGESPAVRAAQRQVVEAEARLAADRASLRALEQDLQALNEKIAEVEKGKRRSWIASWRKTHWFHTYVPVSPVGGPVRWVERCAGSGEKKTAAVAM